MSSDSLGTSSNNGPFPILFDKIWWWKKFWQQETIYYVERFYDQTNDNYNNIDNTNENESPSKKHKKETTGKAEKEDAQIHKEKLKIMTLMIFKKNL